MAALSLSLSRALSATYHERISLVTVSHQTSILACSGNFAIPGMSVFRPKVQGALSPMAVSWGDLCVCLCVCVCLSLSGWLSLFLSWRGCQTGPIVQLAPPVRMRRPLPVAPRCRRVTHASPSHSTQTHFNVAVVGTTHVL